jgi:hypothetical protein
MKGIETAFIGRLGGDPQERMSAKGAVWASFTVAVDGNEEQPTWVKVAAFGERSSDGAPAGAAQRDWQRPAPQGF